IATLNWSAFAPNRYEYTGANGHSTHHPLDDLFLLAAAAVEQLAGLPRPAVAVFPDAARCRAVQDRPVWGKPAPRRAGGRGAVPAGVSFHGAGLVRRAPGAEGPPQDRGLRPDLRHHRRPAGAGPVAEVQVPGGRRRPDVPAE